MTKPAAFKLFLPLSDPDLDFTEARITELNRLDSLLREIGLPSSDPNVDGPASYARTHEKEIQRADSSQTAPEAVASITSSSIPE